MKTRVLVLGSGQSINDLTKEEREFLDELPIKIGINKYSYFHDVASITPNEIFFQDTYDKSAKNFLKAIFHKAKLGEYGCSIFYVSSYWRGKIFRSPIHFKLVYLTVPFLNFFKRILNKSIRLLGSRDIRYDLSNRSDSILSPKDAQVFYIDKQKWNLRGNKWAKSLDEPLYHFRGSLTSVLNLISIKYPNTDIVLAGVDFNSPGYFFQTELEKVDFKTDDWTTDLVKKEGKHFSIINHDGSTMDDEFPKVIGWLNDSGNKIFSINRNSHLVEKGYVDFLALESLKLEYEKG